MGSLAALQTYWTSASALAILTAFLAFALILAAAYRTSRGRTTARLRILRAATWLSVVFWTFMASSFVICFLIADRVEYGVAVAKTVAILSISMAVVVAGIVSSAIARGARAGASSLPEGTWAAPAHPAQALATRLATQHGLERVKIRLVSGPPLALAEPPEAIVLSRGLLDLLSSEELGAVLLHELCHLTEADGPEKAFLGAMRRILFFDPFLRLLDRASHREREYRADEWVAKRMGGGAALASALARLAGGGPGHGRGRRHPSVHDRLTRLLRTGTT
jgi:Zn-dependent protease with chaperone function